MIITKKKIISLLLVILSMTFHMILFSPAKVATAGSLWDSQEGTTEIAGAFGEANPDDPVDIRVVVSNVIRIFLGFMGAVFLILIIMGGFKWMTAGGNDQAITDAKARLMHAVIGLTIVIAAYSIAYFVTEKLFSITTP